MSSQSPSRLKKLLRWGLGLLAVLVLGLFLLVQILDRPRPEAEPSADADQLARRLMDAAEVDAWEQTGAVTWDFSGRQQHLWDRQRNYSRVLWGEHEVQLDLASRRGVAFRAGERLDEEEAAPLLEDAWSFWCNDSFWLNPLAKLFDDGTERALVTLEDGGEGLLVTYASGGVTPGDAYLWHAGEDGLPEWWRMWTQILPVGGLEASWEGWTTLETGARIATSHAIAFLDLELRDVRGAADLAGLGEADAFAALEAHLAQP